jgi:hypothetical protein
MKGTVGELYKTLTDDVLGVELGSFATGVNRKLSGVTV